MLRNLLIKIAALTPVSFKRFIYRHPKLLGPLAGALKRAIPSDGTAVVTIPRGPNKGAKLEVDRTTPNYYWLNASYEADVEEALAKVLRPGMRVADVGAHIGFDTIFMARTVGEKGLVYAFEPDPTNMKRLSRNIELNALKNVRLIEKAATDTTGRQRFAAEGEPTSHLDPSASANGIEVECTTLDDAIASDVRIDLMKIDVEDNEVKVLRGASRVLKDRHPALIIEIHSLQSLVGCVEVLREHGYAMKSLGPSACFDKAIAGDRSQDGFSRGYLMAEVQPSTHQSA